MTTFKAYTLLVEKRRKKKKKKGKKYSKYPLFWHGYPLGGYVQYGGPTGEGIGMGDE